MLRYMSRKKKMQKYGIMNMPNCAICPFRHGINPTYWKCGVHGGRPTSAVHMSDSCEIHFNSALKRTRWSK